MQCLVFLLCWHSNFPLYNLPTCLESVGTNFKCFVLLGIFQNWQQNKIRKLGQVIFRTWMKSWKHVADNIILKILLFSYMNEFLIHSVAAPLSQH